MFCNKDTTYHKPPNEIYWSQASYPTTKKRKKIMDRAWEKDDIHNAEPTPNFDGTEKSPNSLSKSQSCILYKISKPATQNNTPNPNKTGIG